jgi:hypothetical protein
LSKRKRIVLAVLNFLNAGIPAMTAFETLVSPQPIEVRWGAIIALATAGMIGLGICLLAYPSQARIAALVAVLLAVLQGVMVFFLGFTGHEGLGAGMVIFYGVIGSAVFGIIPVITLLETLSRSPEPDVPLAAGGRHSPTEFHQP